MRLAFAGTPEFAAVALADLHAAGFELPLVLTQPDRPAGRGMKVQPSPVKAFALAHELPLIQPRSLRLDGKYPDDAAQACAALQAADVDAMVVAAYGLILPQWALDVPRLGCLNIHASLLPRWRGAAPIHRAIEAGDERTGITLMQMDAGLDTGDMLMMEAMPIRADDTTASLHDRLAALGGRLAVRVLTLMGRGEGPARQPQPVDGVTYAHKIDKSEGQIDWRAPAEVWARRIRAFDPFPGSVAMWRGEPVKVWRAHVVPGAGRPGTVLALSDEGVVVACGSEALRLETLQRAGGKRQPADQFLRAHPLPVGETFDVPVELSSPARI